VICLKLCQIDTRKASLFAILEEKIILFSIMPTWEKPVKNKKSSRYLTFGIKNA